MRGVGLAPDAVVRVKLQTVVPCPNAFVVLFTDRQWPAVAPILFKPDPRLNKRYLPCAWRGSLEKAIEVEHHIQASDVEGYWLGIVQVTPGALQGLTGEVRFVNPGDNDLPVQEHGLREVFTALAGAFACTYVMLLVFCLLHRRNRSRLHKVLLTTVLLKFLVMLLIESDLESQSHTGRKSMTWQIFLELIRQVQKIMEVMMFYFIGLGWKVTRAHLRPSEQAFAATISILSFILGSVEVSCRTFAPCSDESFLLTQFTLHSLCFLVVIIGTNFNIFTLQRQISDALASPETGGLYLKHRAYCWFRGLFLYFIITPSVTKFLTVHIVHRDKLWAVNLVQELSLWFIYTALVLLFAPGPNHLKVFELAVVDPSG
eukprot:CAMPEP_0170580046 /NCGR_PEP_ID=MMETSP0224-20130122/6303_1 /TAXON_ID=285029 /ORGANISM="Togula jolla, Strain CCCM 725" /LENGTH=372 /DNA_ID=CAMNT_0010903101 /DNA_START=86 /DNA_END=1201 /DNA_ORIENTATION=-